MVCIGEHWPILFCRESITLSIKSSTVFNKLVKVELTTLWIISVISELPSIDVKVSRVINDSETSPWTFSAKDSSSDKLVWSKA